ncbi:MAG: hypothetical protein M3457_19945, partial [Chloroflexota bacterium]|nr:hypothetical protein [Chloroflexota bacterium]
VPDIQDALSESRYGRVATVTVSGSNAGKVAAIAPAAAAVFPGAVNTYLVAPGSQPASVQILDSPGEPSKSSTRRYLIVGAAGFAMFAIGMWTVWLVGSIAGRPGKGSPSDQPEPERSLEAKNSSR